MVDVEKVDFELGARDVGMARVFRSGQAAVDSLQSSYAKLAAFATGGVFVGSFLATSKHIIDTGDAINKASEKYGIGTESLSSLRFAAKLANVEFGDLETGLKKLSVNATAAAGGAKEQGALFEAMGIKVRNAGGGLKATDALLREIADKFALYEDGPAKAALAVELFGKQGANLIPLLNKMKEAEEEARQLGAIYGKDLAKASEDFNDNLTRMNALFQASKIAILNEALPALNKYIEQLIEGRKIAGGFGEAIRLFGAPSPAALLAGPGGLLLERALGPKDPLAVIKDLVKRRDELDTQIAGGPRARGGVDISAAKAELADVKKQIDFATVLATQRGGRDNFDSSINPLPWKKQQPPIVNKSSAPAGPVDNTLEQLTRQYEEMAAKAGELTEFEKAINMLQTDRVKIALDKLKPAEQALIRDKILGYAASVDLAKEDEKIKKEVEQITKQAAEEELRRGRAEAERLESGKQKWIDVIDVTAKYKRDIVDINELEKIGYLNAEQALRARANVWEQSFDAQDKLTKKIEEGTDLWKDFGISAGRSLEDVVLKSHKASDAINAIGNTLASVLLRKYVTTPLTSGFEGLLKNLFTPTQRASSASVDVEDASAGAAALSFATDMKFAGGGGFTVGGAGGTDSQLVRFRATPGERVTVETPGQQGGGGGDVYIDARTTIDARGATADAVPAIAAALRDHERRIAALQSNDAYRRGGNARSILKR